MLGENDDETHQSPDLYSLAFSNAALARASSEETAKRSGVRISRLWLCERMLLKDKASCELSVVLVIFQNNWLVGWVCRLYRRVKIALPTLLELICVSKLSRMPNTT